MPGLRTLGLMRRTSRIHFRGLSRTHRENLPSPAVGPQAAKWRRADCSLRLPSADIPARDALISD